MIFLVQWSSLSHAQKLADGHQFVEAIDSTDLQFIVSALASEKMAGRKSGEPGQRLAAQFVARQFGQLGLAAFDEYKDYMQTFNLVKSVPDYHQVIVNDITLERDKDYVFLGELNSAEQLEIDLLDIRKRDLETLVPAIGNEILLLTDHTDIHLTIEKLRKNGFTMFVVLMESEKYKGLNTHQKISGERGEYLRFEFGVRREFGIFYMDENRWSELIGDKASCENVRASFEIKRKEDLVQTENVLGYVQGEGLENEWIVISAHYDHLGIEDGEIMYGADDNASGVAAMLEIAQAIRLASNLGYRPRRSVLFIAFTGEEQGLLGSAYFVNSGIFSELNVKYELNIDMIGRVSPEYEDDENYVYLIGSDQMSPELHESSEYANTTFTQLTLDYTYNDVAHPLQIYQRSDQWSFVEKGVPSIFYFGGVHDEYHKTTDTSDQINYRALIGRCKLIYHTTLILLNQ